MLDGVDRHYRAPIQNDIFMRAHAHSETLRGNTIDYELSSGGKYLHSKTCSEIFYPSLRLPDFDRDEQEVFQNEEITADLYLFVICSDKYFI